MIQSTHTYFAIKHKRLNKYLEQNTRQHFLHLKPFSQIKHFIETDKEKLIKLFQSSFNYLFNDQYFCNRICAQDEKSPLKYSDYEIVQFEETVTFGGETFSVKRKIIETSTLSEFKSIFLYFVPDYKNQYRPHPRNIPHFDHSVILEEDGFEGGIKFDFETNWVSCLDKSKFLVTAPWICPQMETLHILNPPFGSKEQAFLKGLPAIQICRENENSFREKINSY